MSLSAFIDAQQSDQSETSKSASKSNSKLGSKSIASSSLYQDTTTTGSGTGTEEQSTSEGQEGFGNFSNFTKFAKYLSESDSPSESEKGHALSTSDIEKNFLVGGAAGAVDDSEEEKRPIGEDSDFDDGDGVDAYRTPQKNPKILPTKRSSVDSDSADGNAASDSSAERERQEQIDQFRQILFPKGYHPSIQPDDDIDPADAAAAAVMAATANGSKSAKGNKLGLRLFRGAQKGTEAKLTLDNVEYFSSIGVASNNNDLSTMSGPISKDTANRVFNHRAHNPPAVVHPASLQTAEELSTIYGSEAKVSLKHYDLEVGGKQKTLAASSKLTAISETASWISFIRFLDGRSYLEYFFLGVIVVSGTTLTVLLTLILSSSVR